MTRSSRVSTVLIVDEDPWLVALARLALAKEGMRVVGATTGAAALAAFDGPPRQNADLVVLDVVLPDVSGWEVLRRIREQSDVPVMLLTRRDSDVDKARGLDLGADEYLTKPFSFLELEARARALLRRVHRARRRSGRQASTHRDGPASPPLAATFDRRDLPGEVAYPSPVNGEMDGSPVVALIVESRHLQDVAVCEARQWLETNGVTVELVVPGDDRLYDIPLQRPAWDVAVSRGRDRGGLAVLAAAEAFGVRAINRPAAIDLVRNKVAMQAVLRDHGMPVPRTWFAAHTSVFRDIPAESYPLVVKPFDGDGSWGLALLTKPSDIDSLPDEDGARSLYLAQEFIEIDGGELKLYGIGSHVWAVSKPSPVAFLGPGPAELVAPGEAELVELDATLRDIAMTCGRAFGLELWGVDVAMTRDGPKVIEVNDFPTYSAVPGAGAAIAQYVQTVVFMERLARLAGHDRIRASVREG